MSTESGLIYLRCVDCAHQWSIHWDYLQEMKDKIAVSGKCSECGKNKVVLA